MPSEYGKGFKDGRAVQELYQSIEGFERDLLQAKRLGKVAEIATYKRMIASRRAQLLALLHYADARKEETFANQADGSGI